MNYIKTLVILSVIIIVLSNFAFAAGSSTTRKVENKTNESQGSQAAGASIRPKISAASPIRERLQECDDLEARRDRISCKLKIIKEEGAEKVEAYNEESERYEACQNLADRVGAEVTTKEQCIRLYRAVGPCYDLDNTRAKLACFKRHAFGTDDKRIGDADKQQVRQYIVTLLYELQERIEKALEDGKIEDTEKAAEAIDKIVEIKEAIMSGESRDTVKPMIQELRMLIKELKTLGGESE